MKKRWQRYEVSDSLLQCDRTEENNARGPASASKADILGSTEGRKCSFKGNWFLIDDCRLKHLKQQPARSEPGLSLDMVDDAEIERTLVGGTLRDSDQCCFYSSHGTFIYCLLDCVPWNLYKLVMCWCMKLIKARVEKQYEEKVYEIHYRLPLNCFMT